VNKLKKGSIRNGSTVLKMALIGALLLVFLIPLHMIRALIEERNMTRLEAERQIVGMWGGEQVVAGPVVVVPYLKRVEEEGRIEEYVEKAYFLPRSLEIGGTVNTEKRRRGIYEVTVYTADLQVSGNFSAPDLSAWRVAGRDVLWQEAAVLLELPDMRGLQQEVSLQWDGRRIPFSAGQGEIGLYGGEIRTALERGTLQGGSEHRFSFALHLHGGRSLRFLPLGEQTRVRLASAWESPSFTGAFLPAERSVGAGGFEADWYILSLNRAYPQRWLRSQVQSDALLDSAFGVELMIPVDSYLKSLRSVKYGILFVLLPFLVFWVWLCACSTCSWFRSQSISASTGPISWLPRPQQL
jgi:inner membrane protein